MKIGELAKSSATPVETIRYYEREGLLAAPARSDANYRVYGPAHASVFCSSAIAARST